MQNLPTHLMIGLGKIGLAVTQTLLQNKKSVVGVSRQASDEIKNLTQTADFCHISADARHLTASQILPFADSISHICVIVAPARSNSQSSEQAYRDTYFAICENLVRLQPYFTKLQRVVFISSTSVYSQNNGEIVNIHTPIQPPQSPTAQILYQAENLLQQNFANKCTIIRPSGIYGVGRLRLINMVKGIANQSIAPPQNTWTNRIFDTDLVTMITSVLYESSPLPIYIATDTHPVPLYEVLEWLAQNLGLTLALPTIPAKSSKRLISNLPLAWLQYQDFTQGYRAVLEQE